MGARTRKTGALGRIAGLLLIAASGCSSTTKLRVVPEIQDVELRDGTELQGRMTLAWRGLHEVEVDGRTTYEIRFRLRIENPATTPFTLGSTEFELLDAALVPFGPARVEGMPAVVEAGGDATFDIVFPFPEGRTPDNYEFSTLSLRASFQNGRWTWSLSFQRAYYRPYDPYWDSPAMSFHVGAVISG